jgi:hypothetical protein
MALKMDHVYPMIRWPSKPHWILDGFDFRAIPVHEFESSVHILHVRDFTTGVPKTKLPRPRDADYFRMTANNVVVQFRAMLYCKDAYPSWVFWQRVSDCAHGRGRNATERLEDLFVRARTAYRQTTGSCPNAAARVVDEWIAFRETLPIGAPIPPSVTTSWDTRFEEWQAMKGRGELADLGRPYIPQAMPAPKIALRGIVVKQEAVLDHAPNADPGHVAPFSKRK